MAKKIHIPNPLPYVDGQKFGEYLRSNKYPKLKPEPTKSVTIAPKKIKRTRIPKGKI